MQTEITKEKREIENLEEKEHKINILEETQSVKMKQQYQ